MNAPVAVHLGDSLPSAATGKTDLHKSANKGDLSAAKSQEFSNLLLAAQEKGKATASASLEDVELQGQDVKADGAKDSKSVEEDAEAVTPSVSLPMLNAVIAQPVLAAHASAPKVARDGVESVGDTDKSKTAPHTEKSSTDPAPTLQPIQGKETAEAMLLPASLPNMFPTLTGGSTAASDEKGVQVKSDNGSSAAVAVKVVLGASALDKVGGEYSAQIASSAVAQGQQLELSAKHTDGSDGTTEAVIAQPVLASPASTTKVAKDGVESAGDVDKSKTALRPEKASTDLAPSLQPIQAKETTEAMLLPAALPNMFPTLTGGSTAASDEKGVQDKSDSGSSAAVAVKVVLGASALDKVGGEYSAQIASSAVAQGQQLELSAKHTDGSDGTTEATAGISGSDAAGVSVDGRPTASATPKAASAVDVSVAKSGVDGASGVSNSAASATASDAVRDAAAASSASDATQKAASTAASGVAATVAATAAVASTTSPAASHDAAASVLPTGTHDVPAAPAAPTAPGPQTAMPEAGSLTPKSDGLERTASANSGLGSTDAHALLDGTTATGRDGTWQISSNRVEAGFANDQNSWTSVVAQRQQGHVTAMVELGSAAEHSNTASMLPQLNAHLAERQLPVDQLGVSVRQQFTPSGQDASASNQGQQSNQSSQSQRGQQTGAPVVSSAATTPAGTEGSRAGFDGNRISIRA